MKNLSFVPTYDYKPYAMGSSIYYLLIVKTDRKLLESINKKQ